MEVLALAAEILLIITTATDKEKFLALRKLTFINLVANVEKKVEAAAASNVVECTTCHLKQKLNSCSSNWYVHTVYYLKVPMLRS